MSAGTPPPFHLPPEVTVTGQPVAGGVAYVFHHRRLGLLGQLIATDYLGQQTLLTAEVAGQAADPMTAARRTILEPLVDQLAAGLPRHLGGELPPRQWLSPTPVQHSGPTHRVPAQPVAERGCRATR